MEILHMTLEQLKILKKHAISIKELVDHIIDFYKSIDNGYTPDKAEMESIIVQYESIEEHYGYIKEIMESIDGLTNSEEVQIIEHLDAIKKSLDSIDPRILSS